MMTHALNDQHHHDDSSSKVIFGFWIYIMTDCILFASLFATYIVLRNNTYGGICAREVATLPYVLIQSFVFLTSGLTYGLAMLSVYKNKINHLRYWVCVTFILGLVFLGLEFHQFANLFAAGSTWQTSAFLSAYFSLVGIQGIHVAIGMLWMIILMIQLSMQKLNSTMKTRFSCLGLFWDFLNIVWILIFIIVYLMGAI